MDSLETVWDTAASLSPPVQRRMLSHPRPDVSTGTAHRWPQFKGPRSRPRGSGGSLPASSRPADLTLSCFSGLAGVCVGCVEGSDQAPACLSKAGGRRAPVKIQGAALLQQTKHLLDTILTTDANGWVVLHAEHLQFSYK